MTWLRECIVTLVTFMWLFSTVFFQMCPQIACLRGCIVTLVAFVWLFSTVFFQMSPQIAFLNGCIVTLVTFVRLVSIVHLHMSFQMACIRWRIVTLVAFLQMGLWVFPQVFQPIRCIFALVTLVRYSVSHMLILDVALQDMFKFCNKMTMLTRHSC